MSKSPNILIPALGGTALVLGLAIGISSQQYGAAKIESLESQVENVAARASLASDKATAEAARAAELENMIAQVQAAAAARPSSLTAPAPIAEGAYGLGRAAMPEEISAWDVDVLPDGRGLPEGSGDAFNGEEVFADKCASCHGDFAEGVDNWPVLAGGFDTLADEDPVKTVGSYWPYLSTVWDYIHRSMPFGEAGTLTADETYAIVAYILYSNDLVDDDFVLSHENFADFEMHNQAGFVVDDRPTLEYAPWSSEPCMSECKEEVEVTMRSVFLVETPEVGTESVMNNATLEGVPSFTKDGPSFIPVSATPEPENAAATSVEAVEEASSGGDAALIAAGEKVFKKCKACHQVGANAKNRSGPHLNGLIGRTMGSVEGFKYSKVFAQALEEGRVWDEASLVEFLSRPRTYMKGTKMSFAGLKKDADLEAITAYLKSVGE